MSKDCTVNDAGIEVYRGPGRFADSDSREVIDFAWARAGRGNTDLDKTLKLYYAVRD